MEKPPRPPLWQALGLAWELVYLIVIPLVAFALGGRWLDRHYGTSPWFLLSGMVVAIIITTVLLIRKFSTLLKNTIPPVNDKHLPRR